MNAEFLKEKVFDAQARADLQQMTIVRIEASELGQLRAGDNVLLIISIDPVKLSLCNDVGAQRLVSLRPFTVFTICSRQCARIVCGEKAEVLAIALQRPWCEEISARSGAQGLGLADIPELTLHPEIPPLVQSIRRQVMARTCPDEPFFEGYVALLLCHLLWNKGNSAIVDRPDNRLGNERLHDILRDIERAIEEPIRVSDLARECGLTSSQFSRAFKLQVGVPPREYILERRLHRARALLEETDQPLCDIALDAGFSSQAHLTSMFARQFGVPPGQYRKLLEGGDSQTADETAERLPRVRAG